MGGGGCVCWCTCVREHVFESHLRQFVFARINDVAAYTQLHHSMHQHNCRMYSSYTHTTTIQPQQLSLTHKTCHIRTLLLSKTQFEVTLRRGRIAILCSPRHSTKGIDEFVAFGMLLVRGALLGGFLKTVPGTHFEVSSGRGQLSR